MSVSGNSQKLNIDSLKKSLSNQNDTAQISVLSGLASKQGKVRSEATAFIYGRLRVLYHQANVNDYKVKAGLALSERYRTMAQPDSAAMYQDSVYPFVINSKNNLFLSQYYYSVGFTKNQTGDFEGAQKAAVESIKYAELSKLDERITFAYILLSGINYDMKDYNKAMENAKVGITYAERTTRKDLMAYLYSVIGNCMLNTKKSREAAVAYERALAIYDSTGNKSRVAQIMNSLGGVYYDMSDYTKAGQYFRKSYSLKEEMGDPTIVSSAMNLVNYYIDVEKLDSAFIYLKISENLLAQNQNVFYTRDFYERNVDYWAARKDYKQALDYCIKLKNYNDSIYNTSVTTASKDLEEKYQNEVKSRKLETSEKERELAQLQSARDRNFLWGLGTVLILAIGLGFFVYNSYRQKKKLSDQLAIQNAEISMQKKEITDSINYATHIQQSILIPEHEWKKHLPESFILYLPKDVLSGDFYWMETVNDGILFSVADCTGHGVPGAMVSLVCSGALKSAVKEHHLNHPAEILDKSCDLLADSFQSSQDISDGMDVAICKLNRHYQLEYSGANNPLIYFSKGELHEVKANKQPVGRFEKREKFINHTIQLDKGDMIYLFSDGYADQFGGQEGKKFMLKKLRSILAEIQHLPVAKQQERLFSEFTNWKGNLSQVDDICVVGVRI
jgi:serine phosphatase RsbU (regulator of sigma subunit)